MPEKLHIILFCILFAGAIIWLAMVAWLFRRLRLHGPTFEAIGSPDLFFNNTPRANWLFLKFLYGREWQTLGDVTLVGMLWVMRVWLVAYLILFAALFASDFII